MNRGRIAIAAGVLGLAAAATAIGVALGANRTATRPSAVNVPAAAASGTGYGPMMGGSRAPGWMMGGSLPSSMMGGSMMGGGHDPGKIMGRWLANAPGPRVSAAETTRLADQIPIGAKADQARHRLILPGRSASVVRLAAVASPAGGPDETFRIAGMVNPTIVVPAGTRISIQVVNADPDTAHGLVIARHPAASQWMPMMTAAPAFTGAALWVLGDPTAAGMHTATFSFTASSQGSYQYLCPVPGHAAKGMAGTFLVG